MDSYMWLGVMMPLPLTIAPDFLPVLNGKIFLFIHYLFGYLFFFQKWEGFLSCQNVVFQISVNPFRGLILLKILSLLLDSKYFEEILHMHSRFIIRSVWKEYVVLSFNSHSIKWDRSKNKYIFITSYITQLFTGSNHNFTVSKTESVLKG